MPTETILAPSVEHPKALEDLELRPTQQTHERSARESEERASTENTSLTKSNLLRVIAASLSFFFAGNNDGSLGALTPYILRTYNVGTEYVALMYVDASNMLTMRIYMHPDIKTVLTIT